MRVLLISLFSNMPHHVATELEILQRHLDEQDEIELLVCNGDLPACLHKTDPEPAQQARRCRECITTRSAALRLLDRALPLFVLDDFYTAEDRRNEQTLSTKFDSLEAVRDYTFDGFDLGYAALSSTVFMVRDAHLEKQSSQDLLARMLVASYRTYCSVQAFLKQRPRFDRAYIFNGRFATCRGAFRACQKSGLEVYLHERGSDNSKYMLYQNSLPHDLEQMDRRIRERWQRASDDERESAKFFFDQRRSRVEAFWHSHTKSQEQGRLPANWDDSKRNIAIYSSSDDEYVAIGREWVTPGFESQTSAILNLCRELESHPEFRVYVRIHPHLKGVDNMDTRALLGLHASHVEVIRPESNICSYALLDRSEKVITFGSTIGLEATYWRKPSILAGMSFYRSLEAVHVAKNDDELRALTIAHLDPRPVEPALMYGLYMTTFGEPFRYYRAANFETGDFKGTRLRTAMPYSPFSLLLPIITKRFGSRPRQRHWIESLAYATCYLPFRWVYDVALPLRIRMRGRTAHSS